jgi:tripartite-type tricarboxylate transporter receptor subunit TctC
MSGRGDGARRVVQCIGSRKDAMIKACTAALLVAGGLFAAAVTDARAEYPDHPIRVLAGFAPGGATDVAARIIVGRMSEALGQQLLIDNRPGGSTNLAAGVVAKAPPDGYTLFIAGNTNAVNPALGARAPIDILKFTPIALWAAVPNVLVVSPSLGVKDLQGLITLAKSKPDGLTFGSSGVGSISHLSGQYLANRTGAKLTHVPYKGSAEAMTDLLAGRIDMMFAARSTVTGYLKAGKLVALASSTSKRPKGLEDLPTVAESGVPGFEANIWFGIVAPPGTPAAIVAQLEKASDVALADPKVQSLLALQGIEPFPGNGEAFWAYMKSEMTKWAALVKESHITSE